MWRSWAVVAAARGWSWERGATNKDRVRARAWWRNTHQQPRFAEDRWCSDGQGYDEKCWDPVRGRKLALEISSAVSSSTALQPVAALNEGRSTVCFPPEIPSVDAAQPARMFSPHVR